MPSMEVVESFQDGVQFPYPLYSYI